MSLSTPKIEKPKLPYVGPVANYERDRASQPISTLSAASATLPLSEAAQRNGGRPSLLGGV